MHTKFALDLVKEAQQDCEKKASENKAYAKLADRLGKVSKQMIVKADQERIQLKYSRKK